MRRIFRIREGLLRRFFVRYNRMKFHFMGISFGDGMNVYNKVFIVKHKNAVIEIGDNFTMTSGWGINPLCRNMKAMFFVEPDAKLIIGNNTGLSSPCLWVKKSLSIGNYVKIGGDCIILDTDCHNLDWETRRRLDEDEFGRSIDCSTANSSPIIIEDDVLIGARCIILKGVTIGARSIIAAGSVVTKSIPADCVAAGNPAKVIRSIITHK